MQGTKEKIQEKKRKNMRVRDYSVSKDQRCDRWWNRERWRVLNQIKAMPRSQLQWWCPSPTCGPQIQGSLDGLFASAAMLLTSPHSYLPLTLSPVSPVPKHFLSHFPTLLFANFHVENAAPSESPGKFHLLQVLLNINLQVIYYYVLFN